MNNLFPPHRDIHETYDLKGSTVGREYSEEKARKNPRAVLKDLNWINRTKQLELGPEKRALLAEQLRRDVEYLESVDVMDYSLLVGIHSMKRGNRDNVRKNTLRVFEVSGWRFYRSDFDLMNFWFDSPSCHKDRDRNSRREEQRRLKQSRCEELCDRLTLKRLTRVLQALVHQYHQVYQVRRFL